MSSFELAHASESPHLPTDDEHPVHWVVVNAKGEVLEPFDYATEQQAEDRAEELQAEGVEDAQVSAWN